MGTMYNYVRSKEDILYIVYDFMTTILTEGLRKTIEDTEDPRQKVSAALRHNMELIYQYQDVIMFLYREAGNYDRESVRTVLAQETKYIEVFEELLRLHFAGRKINEARLKMAADILSYLNVILVLRGWSLRRRYKSMDDVVNGILEFVEHAIEIVEDTDRGARSAVTSRNPPSPNAKGERNGETGQEKMIEFYRQMLRIRRAEEKLMEVFSAGEILGFLHASIGQEAAPVGVCSHLRDDDYIGTTHRGHGYAIAKGIELKRAMAELFGRRDGYCMGRSGSMHLADLSKGIMGANGIVGGGIPIVTGAGFAAKYKGTDQVAVATFGDGATNQGTFHESLNLASVMNLPVIFLCENNGWAEFSPRPVYAKIENHPARAPSNGMPGVIVTNAVVEIYEACGEAVEGPEGRRPTSSRSSATAGTVTTCGDARSTAARRRWTRPWRRTASVVRGKAAEREDPQAR
jgi:AcrR family transcriptional regulator